MHFKDEHSLAPKVYNPARMRTLSWQDAGSIMLAGTFGDRWRYAKTFCVDPFVTYCTERLLPASWINGISSCIAGIAVAGFTLHKDYAYAKNLQRHYEHFMRLHQIHVELKQQMVAIARYMRTLEQLSLCWQQLPYFAQHPFFKRVDELLHMQDAAQQLKPVLDFCTMIPV